MIDFLREEGITETILKGVGEFRRRYSSQDDVAAGRPRYVYYGKEVWEQAITALLCGENLLLAGSKATGKNVLAENLSALFGRPSYNVSFHINMDASYMIGTDTFKNGQVVFRPGPICQSASEGGFCILDEINMARNEALAVLHSALDFRRIINVPGYDAIRIHEASRFIATMNYGYAGTRELNEALASRFMVIHMPEIREDNLEKLLRREFPDMKDSFSRLILRKNAGTASSPQKCWICADFWMRYASCTAGSPLTLLSIWGSRTRPSMSTSSLLSGISLLPESPRRQKALPSFCDRNPL